MSSFLFAVVSCAEAAVKLRYALIMVQLPHLDSFHKRTNIIKEGLLECILAHLNATKLLHFLND